MQRDEYAATIEAVQRRLLAVGLITFVAGILLGRAAVTTPVREANYYQVRGEGFKMVSPLLRCETPETQGNKDISGLKIDLQKYIDQAEANNQAKSISVYFRDPGTGNWLAINDEEKYTPASLLKVPTMMAYFKEAESNPELLNKKLKFEQIISSQEANIKPTKQLVLGESYTVDDLIFRMIAYSDNDAKDVLMKNINQEEFDGVFKDIQLPPIDYSQTENFMTVRNYAAFFRTLYNASYLSDKSSEKALELLSGVDYKQGLVAGVPPGTLVAHKFGERNFLPTGEKQLHDCGIVYHPKSPYLLCVMTRGTSFETLAQTIQTISILAYQAVDRTIETRSKK